MQNIVNSDETYLQYAKQFFANPITGTNLQFFADFLAVIFFI